MHSDTLLPCTAATKHGMYSDTLIHHMTCIPTPYSLHPAATYHHVYSDTLIYHTRCIPTPYSHTQLLQNMACILTPWYITWHAFLDPTPLTQLLLNMSCILTPWYITWHAFWHPTPIHSWYNIWHVCVLTPWYTKACIPTPYSPYTAATKHDMYADTLIHQMTYILTPYSSYTDAA